MAMAEEETYRWMQVEEGGSMEQFWARRVSDVLPAVNPCSRGFLGAGRSGGCDACSGVVETRERKNKE